MRTYAMPTVLHDKAPTVNTDDDATVPIEEGDIRTDVTRTPQEIIGTDLEPSDAESRFKLLATK